MADIITLGSLNLNDVTTYGTISVNAPDPQLDETMRIITLNISVGGANHDTFIANVRAIRNEINQAQQAYNAARYESFVSLGLGLGNATEVVYFTVKRGWVDDLTGAFGNVFNRYGTGQTPIVVTLECEAVGVGDAVVDSVSATISGDSAGWTYFREAIPGDEPAYAVMTLTDTSTSTSVLNRIHIGHLSRQDLTSGDFDGWYDLSTMSGATLNSPASDSVGGDNVSRSLSSFWSWTDLASVTAPTPLAANSGLFHVYARVKDHSTVAQSVRNLRVASRSTAGSLPAGSYMVVVAAWSSSRAFLAAVSEPVYFTVSGALDATILEWDTPIGFTPTGHSIYWKRNGEDWKYKDSGSSNTYTFTDETSATVEDPPSIPSPQPCRFRLRHGLESGNVMHTATEVEARISNNQWEALHLGTIQLPPQTTAEGQSIEPWRLEIQALNTTGSGVSRTVSADAICLIPAESSNVMAEYEGLNLATKRKWLLATDRSGGRTALLQNTGDDTEEGHLSMRGALRVGPGDTEFVFIPLEANGVSDVTNSQFTVDLTIYPAYRSITGTA